jgi:excisionase family DNA binding protein
MDTNKNPILSDEFFKNLESFNKPMVHIIRHGQSVVKDSWLSSKEVAKILGISTWTLRKYRVDGKITYYRISRKILFQESDVIQTLEKFKVSSFITNKNQIS